MSKGSKQRPTDKSKYDSTYEKIFKDPEREAFDLINKCSTLEDAQECLHREKDNRGWELHNKRI